VLTLRTTFFLGAVIGLAAAGDLRIMQLGRQLLENRPNLGSLGGLLSAYGQKQPLVV